MQSWGLAGALVTYQQSFADDFGREPTSLLTAQPIVFYNLTQGFYLRSSAIWSFDFQDNLGYIPVGFGAGKVTKFGKVTANFFVEPQHTAYHYGQQVPHWQIYAGMNFSSEREDVRPGQNTAFQSRFMLTTVRP